MGVPVQHRSEKAVRLEQTEGEDGQSGYIALWITQEDGQWSLACDGSYATDDERLDVHVAILDMASAYLKVGQYSDVL